MNKTVTINLSGLVFQVDEHAYQDLSNYLNAIKARFKQTEGGEEIIADIEARIAEMFSEKLSPTKQVILQADVDEVMHKMGRPEEFETGEEEEAETTYTASEGRKERVAKRLFRDPDDKVLGGVCSGISAYFGVKDPIWLRLIFAIAFLGFGTGLFLYIILWVIIPKASSTAEKLSMRGESINISNIEKTIRDEINDINERYGNKGRKHAGKARSALGDVIGFFISLVRMTFKIALKLAGVGLVMTGIFALGVVVLAIILGISVGGFFFHSWMPIMMANMWEVLLAALGVFLAAGIPAIGLILLGALVFRRRPFHYAGTGISLFGLWIVGLIICGVLGVRSANEVAYEEKVREEIVLDDTNSDVVYLELEQSDLGRHRYYEFFNARHLVEDGDHYLLRNPEKHNRNNSIRLDVVKSKDETMRISKVVTANGASRNEAHERAEGVEYEIVQQDSLITFDDHFRFDKLDGLRGQEMELTIQLPVGKSIYLQEGMAWIIYDIKNVNDVWDGYMVGHTWTMTGRGLVCQDCAWLEGDGATDGTINEYGVFTFELRDFNEVSINGAFTVNIEQGPEFEVNIKGDGDFMDGIEVEKRGDELKVRPKRNWLDHLWNHKGEVNITMPALEAVEFGGTSKAKVIGFTEQEMDVRVTGASEAELDMTVSVLDLTVRGASEVRLRGSGDQLTAEIEGASTLKALEYEVAKANVEANGASEAAVNVTEELDVEAGGASEVRYKGLPTISSDVSGFSSIKPLR